MISFLNAAPVSLDVTNIEMLLQKLIDLGVSAGKSILGAILVYVVGRFLIKILNKILAKMLDRHHVELSVQTFVKSFANILLTILLVISVIGALGVNTTSFAALLASAGVAIGMALSGNLQNFAGGLVILIFKPYKVGDYIEAQGVSGSVKEVQIFHTILTTPDNKVIYLPNGGMSTAVLINYNREETRRVDWTIGVDYGQDVEEAYAAIRAVLDADQRIMQTPAPYVAVSSLTASSVDIVVRAWVKTEDYWDVNHSTIRAIYDKFNACGINFPFPQQTIHIAKN